jgi:hypothetical protein
MFEKLSKDDSATRTVQLGLRADIPTSGPVTRVTGRLEDFCDSGDIDGYAVRTWPARVRFDVDPHDSAIVDLYQRFWAWADDHGGSIRPAFDIRQGQTMLGEHEQVLLTPVLFGWVVDGDELVALAPFSVDGRTYSVDDLLNALESTETGSTRERVSA